ncbi:hypothetical protein [Rhizobium croatiense]|uniref:hypothetical protein n=1 Tax=Rhizobium croatiense TaxID=2867516 RepID=UPI0023EB032D|nr:hypothetical protein [Rhizobium croatiense]WET74110.1 hypothetical protein PYR68_00790 [Rhizobium croatiense]
MAKETAEQVLGYLHAAHLCHGSIQMQLLRSLRAKGILSVQETNELLDEALAFIEQLQLKAPAHEQWIYDLARGHVEAALPAVGGDRKRAK